MFPPCEPARASASRTRPAGAEGLRTLEAHRSGLGSSESTATRDAPGVPGEGRLVCRLCAQPITSKADRIPVSGSHLHTFANPHGFVYRIGCFSSAPGCLCVGEESTDFPWFAGYTWQASICAKCGTHLGWRFRRTGHTFLGLIVDKLAEQSAPSGE